MKKVRIYTRTNAGTSVRTVRCSDASAKRITRFKLTTVK